VDTKYECPAACPQDNTWYPGGSLTVPAGKWRISDRAVVYSARTQADPGTVDAFTTLSINGVSVTDPAFTAAGRAGGNLFRAIFTLSAEKLVTLRRPTTFTLLVSESSGGGWDKLHFLGSVSPTTISAERVG